MMRRMMFCRKVAVGIGENCSDKMISIQFVLNLHALYKQTACSRSIMNVGQKNLTFLDDIDFESAPKYHVCQTVRLFRSLWAQIFINI